MKTIPIVKENLRAIILDFSLPSVISIIAILNLAIGFEEKIFSEPPTPFPFWFMTFLDSMIITIYGGYIGAKYFAREFDKKTITSLILSPPGENGVFLGKFIAALVTGILISALILLQFISFYIVWGSLPYLFVWWYGYFSAILMLSFLFAYFLSISVGSIIKKTGMTLLLSSLYAIISLFILAFVPLNDLTIDTRFFYSIFFPSMILWYEHLSIEYYAVLSEELIFTGIFGTSMIALTSYFIFKGVKF